MNNLEDKIALPPEAIKLFQKISLVEDISIKDLEAEAKIDRGKLEYYLSYLESNKLVERSTKISKIYELTNAGTTAVKDELIERRIHSALKEKQPMNFNELAEFLNCDKREMNAGIGYLKKFDLIVIEKGKISLVEVKSSVSDELQTILNQMSKKQEVDISRHQDELLQRNLIAIVDAKVSSVKVLISYKDIQDKIIAVTNVSRLTPDMIRDGSWKDISLKEYNMKVSPPVFHPGRKQLYAQFLDEVKQKLVGLGFKEMRGPIVELEFWNFDALYQAQDHPAREWSDVYRVDNPKTGNLPKEKYVKNVKKAHENGYDTGSKGWRYNWAPEKAAKLILRAQGTSVSARTLVDLKIPSKYFSISRCFRPDSVDATHLSEFNQMEGIVADPSITFRDLLGILTTFATDIVGTQNYVFKPDYYPFTEPSVELSVRDPIVGNVEFGGAGIFRPEVTRPFNIDVPVIAWGLGIDRLFMVKHGITDIRELFSHKMEWLRTARIS